MKILLSDYDPQWIREYHLIKKSLLKTFKEISPRIEHVGSTSVKGLRSKPVIDVLIGVSDLKETDHMISGMEKLGYEYVSKYDTEIPDRRYFKKKDKIHLHIVVYKSEFWNRLILFRDYLRINKDVRNDYCKLKTNLSELEWKSSNEYSFAKTEFIRRIENEAENYIAGKK